MKITELPRNMVYLGSRLGLKQEVNNERKRTTEYGVAIDMKTGEYYLIDKDVGAMRSYKKYPNKS